MPGAEPPLRRARFAAVQSSYPFVAVQLLALALTASGAVALIYAAAIVVSLAAGADHADVSPVLLVAVWAALTYNLARVARRFAT